MAQPYKNPVLKKMIEPRYGQKPENEILRKKEVGVPLNFNMGGTYYPDIQRSLYDQGVPDRSRWVQEAGNTFLAQISEKKYEPPRPKKYHYAKTQILSSGDFPLGRNPWTCSN